MTLGISVDPGCKKGLSYAIFDGGHLVCADFVVGLEAYKVLPTLGIHYGVIECPVIRDTRFQKGRQSDITNLTLIVGQIMGHHAQMEWTLVKPEEWKRQLPKPIVVQRVKSRLSKLELERVYNKRHDVWEAIGIGLYVYDRKRALV